MVSASSCTLSERPTRNIITTDFYQEIIKAHSRRRRTSQVHLGKSAVDGIDICTITELDFLVIHKEHVDSLCTNTQSSAVSPSGGTKLLLHTLVILDRLLYNSHERPFGLFPNRIHARAIVHLPRHPRSIVSAPPRDTQGNKGSPTR
jgi:hypothetical protein